MNIFSCSFIIFSASPTQQQQQHPAKASESGLTADTRKRPSELGKGLWLPPLGQLRLQTGLGQLC